MLHSKLYFKQAIQRFYGYIICCMGKTPVHSNIYNRLCNTFGYIPGYITLKKQKLQVIYDITGYIINFGYILGQTKKVS